jgi:hypothetical protein
VKDHTPLPFSMALSPERYDHFKNFFHHHECFSKATSSFKSGKIYLKCNGCLWETPVYPRGNSWNVGNFKNHRKASPNCDVNGAHEETIQMDTNNSSQVSMALDFITFVTFN